MNGRRLLWGSAASAALVLAAPASAEPRAVIELFTSQGCSSCPDADRIIGELAKNPDVIALSLPIDYWDYLGWKDTLADARFTARQKAYSSIRGDRSVYTPQVVVNGVAEAVGNDRDSIDAAITQSRAASHGLAVPVSMSAGEKELSIAVAAAPDASAARSGEVWLCSVARSVPIAIKRGENRGRDVTYHNVVRSWLKIGDWNGHAGRWTVPLENVTGAGVDAAVVYVQDGSREKPGAMLGAAIARLR